MTKKPEAEARFAYEGLDRVIHERARLSVLTSLTTHAKGLSFVELKRLCGLTDGNLARHLQVLEEEGLVRSAKQEDRAGRVHTLITVSARGRQRFLAYLTTLERVIRDAQADASEEPLLSEALPT